MKKSTPTPKSQGRRVRKYSWIEIKKAISMAFGSASIDTWNVPYFYEGTLLPEMLRLLRSFPPQPVKKLKKKV